MIISQSRQESKIYLICYVFDLLLIYKNGKKSIIIVPSEVGEHYCGGGTPWRFFLSISRRCCARGFARCLPSKILLQVIDTYFGKLHIVIGFGDGEASMHITKCGQYVFDGIDGYVLAKSSKE